MAFDSGFFWEILFSEHLLIGAGLSIAVAVVAQAVAVVIGFGVAMSRHSGRRVIRSGAWVYIWVFRAIPTLLILLIVWNALPQLITPLTNPWFTPFIAAVIALSFQEAAYMAEIIRSAMLSVDDGQRQAARALGLSPVQVLQRVIVPQMVRIAIPPTGSEFINMVKYTSLASVISLQELLTRTQIGVSNTFKYAEYYAVAAIYYLVIVSILTILQSRLERRFRWVSRTPTQGGSQRKADKGAARQEEGLA